VQPPQIGVLEALTLVHLLEIYFAALNLRRGRRRRRRKKKRRRRRG
jgi:hypothetical protein